MLLSKKNKTNKSKGFLIPLLLICFVSNAQIYFNKRYDFFNKSNLAASFDTINNSCIISDTGFDTLNPNLGIHFLKIDYNGNILLKKSISKVGYDWETDGMLCLQQNKKAIFTSYFGGLTYAQPGFLFYDINGDTIKSVRFLDTFHIADLGFPQLVENKYIVTSGWHDTSGSANGYTKILLLKTDTSGNLIWLKTYGNNNEIQRGYISKPCKDKGYIIAGPHSASPGNWNTMVVKTDSLGNQKWIKYYSNYAGTTPSITSLQDGNFLIATVYSDSFNISNNTHYTRTNLIKIDTGGSVLWNKYYQNSANNNFSSKCYELADKNIVTIGTEGGIKISSCGNEYMRGYILKTDSLGNIVFYQTYMANIADTNSQNYLYSLVQMPDKGFIALGMIIPACGGGTQDTWVIRVDSNGCETPGCPISNGVKEIKKPVNEFMAYPNPTTGTLNINYFINDPTCKTATIQLLELSTGRILIKETVPCNSNQTEIDLKEFPDGVYSLSIYSNQNTFKNVRIIKIR